MIIAILLFLICTSPVSGQTITIASDAFTGTNGTALDGKALDVGGSWTRQSPIDNEMTPNTNGLEIQSNEAAGTNNSPTANFSEYYVDVGRTDYTISVDATPSNVNNFERLIVRLDGGAGQWRHIAMELENGSPDSIKLVKSDSSIVAGPDTVDSETLLWGDGTTLTPGVSYAMKLVVTPTSIAVYLDGVLQTTVATTYLATKTNVGLAVQRQEQYDDFLVTYEGSTVKRRGPRY